MLFVFLSFLYIGITAFLLGFGVRVFTKKYLGYEIREITSLLYAGLGAATVYSGIYSLFAGVSAMANIIMVIGCVAIAFGFRKELAEFWNKQKSGLSKGKLLFAFVLMLLFSYGASRGYLHFDSGLYHAQAIRWIEEYGVVPGLANLHCRLAYNSSAFILPYNLSS